MKLKHFFVFFLALFLCAAFISCDQNMGGGEEDLTYGKKVFDAVNAKRGVNLIWDDKIYEQCKIHSQNMASGKVAFGHDGFQTRIKNLGGGSGAENVAMNHSDNPNDAAMQWMNSSGHKANIMNTSYKKSAVAAVKSEDGAWYYTQIFIP